jgi:hypothetical protein
MQTIVEPLTLALTLLLGVLGAVAGWQVHEQAEAIRNQAPLAAELYAEALCRDDVAYLLRKTGEAAGPKPWEPRLSSWTQPCTGYRHVGATIDIIGREQHVFALFRPDGTASLWIVTLGRDGLVAGYDY